MAYKYGIHRDILFFYYSTDHSAQQQLLETVERKPTYHGRLPGDNIAPNFRLAYEGDITLSPSVFKRFNKSNFELAGGLINENGDFIPMPENYSKLPYNRLVYYADFDSDKDVDAFVIGKITYDQQISDSSKRSQLYFNRDGVFVQSKDFADIEVICQEEQPVIADLDNDEDLDIFLACNTHVNEEAHNYLLINNGLGQFKDYSKEARVQMPHVPSEFRAEGAQAVDIDKDGWLDLYVGSHLFINNHNLTFSNMAIDVGLSRIFDEGVKFSDVNNDGMIDLILYAEHSGPKVFISQKSGMFIEHNTAITENLGSSGENGYSFFGLNMHDLNNDGFEDMVLGKEEGKNTHIFIGENGNFHRIASPFFLDHEQYLSNSPSFGDFNQDVKIDFARRVMDVREEKDDWMIQIYINETPTTNSFFTIELLGQNGERNQQGRTVELRPYSRTDFVITRIVDSGSGYLNQNQYALTIGTPFNEKHYGRAYFADNVVEFTILPNQSISIYKAGTTSTAP